MGRRYGLLPSEVMTKASTFDLEITDLAITYEHYKQNKAEGKTPEVRQDVLEEVIKKARET